MREDGIRAPVFSWAAQLSVVALQVDRHYGRLTGRDLVAYHGPSAWYEESGDAEPQPLDALTASADGLATRLPELDIDDDAYDRFRKVVNQLRSAIDYCTDPTGRPDPVGDTLVLVDIAAVFEAGRPFDDDHEPRVAGEYRR